MSDYTPRPSDRQRSELAVDPAILAVYLDRHGLTRTLFFRGENNDTGPANAWHLSVAVAVVQLGQFARPLFETEPVVRVGPWNVASLFLSDGRTLLAVCRADHVFMKSLRRWMRRYADRLDDPGGRA